MSDDDRPQNRRDDAPDRRWPGAYPPPGGSASLPPEPSPPPRGPMYPGGDTWSEVRPGIVPLRPLGVGDILGGSFAAMRYNPRTMLGVSFAFFLVVGVLAAIPGVISGEMFRQANPWTTSAADVPINVFQIVTGLLSGLLTGFLMIPVAAAVQGRRPGPGATWTRLRPRIPALVGLLLLELLGAALLTLPFIGIGLALGAGALSSDPGGESVFALVLLVVGLFVGFFVALAVLWTFLAFSAPAIVLEGIGPVAGIKRSFRLVRGAFWRTLGVLLLASIVTGIVSVALVVPVSLLTAVVGFGLGEATAAAAAVLLVVGLLTVAVQAVAQPFGAGVTALLYLDRRLRTEGAFPGEPALTQESPQDRPRR